MFFTEFLLLIGLAISVGNAQSTKVQPWIPMPTSVYGINGPNALPRKVQPSFSENTNTRNVRVFIAIALRNAEHLIRGGVWNEALLTLIDILGPENTFVSIYESDSTDGTAKALQELKDRIKSPSSIVSKSLLKPAARREIETPLRRIQHMANVRNHALLPFYEQHRVTTFDDPSLSKPYDRILWMNDVYFDPFDILSLILETNGGDYSAACALDYIDPITMYDYFALRDSEGRIPVTTNFPYFGEGKSREQMLRSHTRDISVKACWGGITSFDARPFYQRPEISFRDSKSDTWEASECCLIHADLAAENATFVNSAVRVAYDEWTFSWLPLALGVERWVYGVLQSLSAIKERLVGTCSASVSSEMSLLRAYGIEQVIRPDSHDGFCSWPFLMYMGRHDETQAKSLQGKYVPGHQDGPNSTYWVMTI
ncbi:putative Cryptococcal mannosyltransferase 1-domain-containing protein [Seiridium cardinale]